MAEGAPMWGPRWTVPGVAFTVHFTVPGPDALTARVAAMELIRPLVADLHRVPGYYSLSVTGAAVHGIEVSVVSVGTPAEVDLMRAAVLALVASNPQYDPQLLVAGVAERVGAGRGYYPWQHQRTPVELDAVYRTVQQYIEWDIEAECLPAVPLLHDCDAEGYVKEACDLLKLELPEQDAQVIQEVLGEWLKAGRPMEAT